MSDDLRIMEEVLGEQLSPDVIDSAVRNARSVIRPLVDTWYPQAHDDEFPPRQAGELSLFIRGSEWKAFDSSQGVSAAYDDGIAALLYAHRVVINSPLLMLPSASIRGKSLDLCRDLLLASLHLLHSLKDLITAGIVVIVGSDANYHCALRTPHATTVRQELIEQIGPDALEGLEGLEYRVRHMVEFALMSRRLFKTLIVNC
jgi:hypothetical protein